MKFKLFISILFLGLMLTVSFVNASDLNETNEIFVDINNGDNLNDGKTQNTSVKTFNKALTIASENDTIILSDGIYSGFENTQLTINKSVNIKGLKNTTFDGLCKNYHFIIKDNVKITFKNINFINAYKNEIYGASLEIKNANVTLTDCSFKNNILNCSNQAEFIFGGAISNLGYLKIINSTFVSNFISSNTNCTGFGGSIYNKGYMIINNSSFLNSTGDMKSNGGAIYNDETLTMHNCTIKNSYLFEDSKGSAIYNNGNLTLLNSIVENNTVERCDYNYIYGAIFNSGTLIAKSNIFRYNKGNYIKSNQQYFGSPTIYNTGDLDLSYNAFVDNLAFSGIFTDIFFAGGKNIKIDDNWWQCSENPVLKNKTNGNYINSWTIFDLTPNYASLNINESIILEGSFKSTTGKSLKNLIPTFNVTIFTIIDGVNFSSDYKSSEDISFKLNNTLKNATYEVVAEVNNVKTISLIDVGKINSNITLNLDKQNYYYKDSVLINVSLTDEDKNPINGSVYLKLNSDEYVINMSNGKGNISFFNLNPRNYTIYLTYNGSSIYSKAFLKDEFRINKIPTSLYIDEIADIKTSDSVYLNITLHTNSGGIGSLYINNEFKQNIYLNNGYTQLKMDYFSEGQYNITIIFPEDEYHENATYSILFNVSKTNALFNITCENITSGNDEKIKIEVLPENFNSEVILSINGVNNTLLLNNKINYFTISSLTSGVYNVSLIFNGNDRFYKSNASSSFTVTQSTSSLNVSILKNNLTGKITVKTIPSKCTGLVTLFINQRSYKSNLNKGSVTFNVDFDVGSNYIYAFYEGDNFYTSSNWTGKIGEASNIFLISQNITGWEHTNITYEVMLCEENGMGIADKNISISFLDETYNILSDNNGIAHLILNLNSGTYTINAQCENYTITNSILVENITFNVTTHNITYLENESIEVSFKSNIIGNIYFKLSNNLTNIIEIINNHAVWNIEKLNSGNYTVEVYYSNSLFNSTKTTKSFNVNKNNINASINISQNDNNVDITVEFSDEINGEACVFVDKKEIIKTNNRTFKLNFKDLTKGYHELLLIFSRDSNFNNLTINKTFSIKSLKTILQLNASEFEFSEDNRIFVKLNENATGKIDFSVNSIKGIADINNGIAVLNLPALNVGNYTLFVEYSGDDLFFNSSNQTTITIKKAKSLINLYVKEVFLDENIRIYANLSSKATGYVTYSMTDYYTPRNKTIINSTSSWYISPLKSGTYTVFANYSGDSNYYPSNTSFILNITQFKSILRVSINDASTNDRLTTNIKLTTPQSQGITGNVVLIVNSKSYEINVNKGSATLVLPKLSVGTYKFTASYEGNENYAKSYCEGEFNVYDSQIETHIEANNITKYFKGSEKLTIFLTDSNGKSVANGEISVKINNDHFTLQTDSEGIALMDIDLKPGIYNAYISFNETAKYYGTNANLTIEVLSTIKSIDLVKVYGGSEEYYAIFTDCEGQALANTQVTFTIDSNSYTFKTAPNGIARLNINIPPGLYTIYAQNPVSGEIITNTIYIFKYIMGNKDIVGYYGASRTYEVQLFDNNGNNVGFGVNVIFNLNGKNYNILTDVNGYARLSFNLKPDIYTLTVFYANTSVTNKIVIKPVLYAGDIIVKKGKAFKFKAKLLNSKGNPLKGKKIIFKLKGKKYTAKTNKKGIATIIVKQKLKKGKHKIKTKYAKSTLTNIIKIIK